MKLTFAVGALALLAAPLAFAEESLSITDLAVVEEDSLSQEELSKILMAQQGMNNPNVVTNGNRPNIVTSGNYPQQLTSGSFPNSVTRGTYPNVYTLGSRFEGTAEGEQAFPEPQQE